MAPAPIPPGRPTPSKHAPLAPILQVTNNRSKSLQADRDGTATVLPSEGAGVGTVRSARDGKPLQLVALPGLQASPDSARVAMRTISGGAGRTSHRRR